MSASTDHNKQLGILSIAYLIIGAILVLWPDSAVRAICYVISIILIIYGVYRIVLYVRSDNTRRYYQLDLVIGLIACIAGVFIALRPFLVSSALPFIIGLCILIDSIVKLQNALDLKRAGMNHWQIPMLVSIITAVLGLILILNPFSAVRTLIICMGLFFIIDGIANISSVVLVFKKIGKNLEQTTTRKNRKQKKKKR